MAGEVDQGGKFFMPIENKLTYKESVTMCSRLGLQLMLPESPQEMSFATSISLYQSNWLRIKLKDDKMVSDDDFEGKINFHIFEGQ